MSFCPKISCRSSTLFGHTGEVDTRFTYCAVATLSVLGTLNEASRSGGGGGGGDATPGLVVDLAAAMRSVASCHNFDGGFGCVPGAESHAGYVFVCVASLSIGGGLPIGSLQPHVPPSTSQSEWAACPSAHKSMKEAHRAQS